MNHAAVTLHRPSRAGGDSRVAYVEVVMKNWEREQEGGAVGRLDGLQSHHMALQIRGLAAMTVTDAIRPWAVGAFPPARPDVHTRTSVVARPVEPICCLDVDSLLIRCFQC
jgi:hypothetical protein